MDKLDEECRKCSYAEALELLDHEKARLCNKNCEKKGMRRAFSALLVILKAYVDSYFFPPFFFFPLAFLVDIALSKDSFGPIHI
jgi:hypothetical protein